MPKFRPAHGGADFRQNFGQHTAAQIFAPTILREKKLRAEGPQIFFETISVEQGLMTKKVCFMTEKVFVLMQPVLHVGVLRASVTWIEGDELGRCIARRLAISGDGPPTDSMLTAKINILSC